MVEQFSFKLIHPRGQLRHHVQAIWSISVDKNNQQDLKRWLHSDACSGVLFNLKNNFLLNQSCFSPGITFLPVSKEAQQITLLPGSILAGVRFHPGRSLGFLGTMDHKATFRVEDNAQKLPLNELMNKLMQTADNSNSARLSVLYRWLSQVVSEVNDLPTSLTKALDILNSTARLEELSQKIPLSHRQIERQFKYWIDMTPKHFQRIKRVKKTIDLLKKQPDVDLANLALNQGFSDQAHMTREFSTIAKITPKKFSKALLTT